MQVLDDLYLTRVKHSIVGSVDRRGISGGQRKRVNIALEVLAPLPGRQDRSAAATARPSAKN